MKPDDARQLLSATLGGELDEPTRREVEAALDEHATVAALLAGGLCLAWPELLTGPARLFAGAAYACLVPLAHLLVWHLRHLR